MPPKLNFEQSEPPETDGVRWLKILGFEDHIGEPLVGHTDGNRQLLAEDFPEVCGEHAAPMMTGFERLPPDHPQYEKVKARIREKVAPYLGLSEGNN